MVLLKGATSCFLGFILEWARIKIVSHEIKGFLQRLEEQKLWLVPLESGQGSVGLQLGPSRALQHPSRKGSNTELTCASKRY